MLPGSSMISRAIRRRGARSTRSRPASRLSQRETWPEAASSGPSSARARAVMSRAATCLQLAPTGHEQLPAHASGLLWSCCLRKTMV